jgi:hypothetical protein
MSFPIQKAFTSCLFPFALATAWTALNACKPLHIDDAYYYEFASQIARAPLDPYGFGMMVWDKPEPAIHRLAPAVLPYYWGLAIHLLGESPVLWKLWLLPWVTVLAIALRMLLARFAPRWQDPLLVLLVFSPVLLPGLNLMLDIPALALSLAAVALFASACDKDRRLWAVAAGLTAGLAIETKYTGLVGPPLLLGYGIVFRKNRLAAYAIACASLVFVGWEAALACRYGESHFVYQLLHGSNGYVSFLDLCGALCPILGAVAPGLLLLGMLAAGCPPWRIFVASIVAVAPYLLLIWAAGRSTDSIVMVCPRWIEILFGTIGGGALLVTGVAAWRRATFPGGWLFGGEFAGDPVAAFLVFWVALELAGYFVLSPYPAVRRVIGLFVAAVLLLGHVLTRDHNRSYLGWWISGAAAFSASVGLVFWAVDYRDASAQREAAETAVHWIRSQDATGTIWHTAYWGFQFYAERAGMKHAVPESTHRNQALAWPAPSHFHAGDWIVMPSAKIPQQRLYDAGPMPELVWEFPIADSIPLSTVPGYYGGGCPINPQHGPRLTVSVYRLRADAVPKRPPMASASFR